MLLAHGTICRGIDVKPAVTLSVALGVVAAFVATIALYHADRQTRTCGPGSGKVAAFRPAEDPALPPDVPFVDGDGRARTMADLKGRGVVLNFWATWCVPCVAEMPALDRLQARLAKSGIEVLALSSDRGGAPVVQAFFARHDIDHLPVALDQGMRAARALGIQGLPTTVLIDGAGREMGRLLGAAEWDSADAVALVEDCLKSEGR
jgi:thiol-disulfide isomerase/thioredoxin